MSAGMLEQIQTPGGGGGGGGGAARSTKRLLSLDAFRGFDIVLMFFVNLSASRAAFPEWFGHAGWNGGRHGQWLADFVFPWFLFIVGVAVPFSMGSGRGQGQSPARRITAAVRRALLIYALGILIWMAKTAKDGVGWADGGFVPKPGTAITWDTLLHWDILPLIALGYLLAVILYHTPRWAQVTFVVVVLAAKWLAMPGLTDQAGLVRAEWIGARHDLEARARTLGFVGTGITQGLPAAATVVLGMLAGHVLRAGSGARALRVLLITGASLCAAAAALHYLADHRISKDFFTSSYVLLSAGSGMLVLAAFYAILDVWPVRRSKLLFIGAGVGVGCVAYLGWERSRGGVADAPWHASMIVLGALILGLSLWGLIDVVLGSRQPGRCRLFVVYGVNAIAIYVAAELTWTLFWMHWRVQAPGDFGGQHAFNALQLHWAALVRPLAGDNAAGLGPWLATATYIGLFGALAWWLDRRRIYIKV